MINTDWFWERVINKKTNELGTIISKSYGGSGNYVTVFLSGQKIIEDIPLSEFNDKYFKPDVSLESELIKEDLIELCMVLSKNFPGLINACRRFKEQESYYTLGALVYFIDPVVSKDLVGPRYPYRITKVHKSGDSRFSFIELTRDVKLGDDNPDLRILLDFKEMSPGSAAMVLSRYDKLY